MKTQVFVLTLHKILQLMLLVPLLMANVLSQPTQSVNASCAPQRHVGMWDSRRSTDNQFMRIEIRSACDDNIGIGIDPQGNASPSPSVEPDFWLKHCDSFICWGDWMPAYRSGEWIYTQYRSGTSTRTTWFRITGNRNVEEAQVYVRTVYNDRNIRPTEVWAFLGRNIQPRPARPATRP